MITTMSACSNDWPVAAIVIASSVALMVIVVAFMKWGKYGRRGAYV